MVKLFKSSEIAKRFKIPTRTALNWSKAEKTWRKRLYNELQSIYANEIAKQSKEFNDG